MLLIAGTLHETSWDDIILVYVPLEKSHTAITNDLNAYVIMTFVLLSNYKDMIVITLFMINLVSCGVPKTKPLYFTTLLNVEDCRSVRLIREVMFKDISHAILNDVRKENTIKVLSIPKKPFKQVFKNWLKDKTNHFCNVTSLHGYVHIVQKDYHPVERWLWIFLTFIAMVTAIVLLWISWNWNAETPTTTVIESTNHPTYNLPFPSVTICSMNKISKTVALDIATSMKKPPNMTDEELALKFKLLLHYRGSGVATAKEYQEINDVYYQHLKVIHK